MIIAMKDKNTTYLAYTNADSLVNMSPEDMLLKDNSLLWKISGLKGWYAACGRFYVETDVLRYSKGLFEKEITYQSLLRHTVPKMKEILDARGLIKDRCWYNELLVVSKDKAYIIDGYFCVNEVLDFSISDAREDIARGCIEFNKGMPARKCICEALHSIEEMRSRSRFPAVVVDVATDKREVWYSYEDALEKMKGAEAPSLQAKQDTPAAIQMQQDAEWDALYQSALQLIIDEKKVSISFLQRALSIGYSKAGRLIEQMEADGYISEFDGSAKGRKIYITQKQFDQKYKQ